MGKVFVYVANVDADAEGKVMTLAPQTFVPACYKIDANWRHSHLI